jgi:arsenate reductase (thioredoxin)
MSNMPQLYTELQPEVEEILGLPIAEERKPVLQMVIDYILKKRELQEPFRLNFICTHNSRRSQLSQIWAQVAAYSFEIAMESYSGGVEETAFNERAVRALETQGFRIRKEGEGNPRYLVSFSPDAEPVLAFSKMYDDPINPTTAFAAVMTCSDADENCPYIPGTEARIPLRYDDPKAFDGTAQESEKYLERSRQIASEMFYIFSRVAQ